MIVYLIALFFLIMGLIGILNPALLAKKVGLTSETADARNEIRAVYGGFGIAIAILMACTGFLPDIRSGVLLAVGVSLLGMAAGRVYALTIERPTRNSYIFLVLEAVQGVSCLIVAI